MTTVNTSLNNHSLTTTSQNTTSQNNDSLYDLIIIGLGPVGSTAAILLAEAGMKVAVVERDAMQGQASSNQS